MDNISFFLEKYANLGYKENKIKEIVANTVKEICLVELKKEQIKIQNNNIKIEIVGPEKSEIFINKEKILNKIKNKIEKTGENFYKEDIK